MTNLETSNDLEAHTCSLNSISADNAFFKRMLGLIPPNILSQEQSAGDKADAEELQNGGDEPSPDDKRKKKKERQKRKKDKKRNELSSFAHTSEVSPSTYTTMKKRKTDPSAADENNLDESPSFHPAPTQSDSLLSTSIADLDEKRAKLRAKIQELQAKRKLNDREKQNKKKLKRQESKMKLKQKRKQEKLINSKPGVANGGIKNKGNNSGNKTPTKPIYNKDGQMVFSKFDFTDSGKKEKKDKQTDLSGKDYKRLLEKIEKRNEKIKKLKNKDEGAAKSLQDKFKWESVLHKAEGQKVKDNPELLKKALKRKEKIKEKRKAKWEDRGKTVAKLQADKQKKRTENLQKRKQAVKDKKIQKAKKKGRMIPGF